MQGLLIIVVLFGLMWFLMIRPQRTKARQQQLLLSSVEVGDEVLTVGGLYGIVQELEPEEEGGDLIVEVADGIHVRIARRGLATVVKPDEDDEPDDELDDDGDDNDIVDGEAELVAEDADSPAGVEEVNGQGETVKPGAAEEPPPPTRS